MQDELASLSFFERIVVRFDLFPMGALFRGAIGYALVPAFYYFANPRTPDWRILPWFLVVLGGLKVGSAVLRRLFSTPVQAVWFRRRDIAKRFDSYQWRKLLWFGLGMAVYIVYSGDSDFVLVAMSAAEIVAGCLGEFVWWRTGTRVVASQ